MAPPGPTDSNEAPDMDDQDEAPVNGKVGSPKSRKNNISYSKSERGSSTHSDNRLFGFVTRSQESSSRKVNLLYFLIYIFNI